MKKYFDPKLDIVLLSMCDVIVTSEENGEVNEQDPLN